MGDRWRPKSSSGVRESARPEQGVEAFEKYGQGEKNPVTGLYEWYDLPPGIARGQGDPVTWPEIVEQWRLLEFDFHAILRVDLSDTLKVRSWRWFELRVQGLLASRHSLLSDYFTKTDSEASRE